MAAYLLALPIGWDREKGERSAGLRTFPLVAIASCGFIQATENLTAGSPEAAARRPHHRHGPHRRRCGPCRDEAIAPVHNRMPVLLHRDDYERWLLGSSKRR
ncbi:MgtC/SapB family protein [Rhizobium populisoli]|uniref:MgtC/SapB family protein n=1 Tax=Rhizobium populisoli TaxID=2859785 RepID=UPI0035E3F810